MREPLVPADVFTYETESIREWTDIGNHIYIIPDKP
jgi:hypothetical protein